MKKLGFTLAEVLITLVIIGVIGALTVPALIQNTQKQEYVTALKKAYSTLSQVTQQIIAEEGSPKGGWADTREHIWELYKNHLNVIKECRLTSECMTNKAAYLGGNGLNWGTDGKYSFILADGAGAVIHSSVSPDCSNDRCAWIQIDINGKKAPNKWGRDLFEFKLTPNGLMPEGCTDGQVCPDYYGHDCACKVLREGAMNY